MKTAKRNNGVAAAAVKTFRNFLLANLLAVAPLWWAAFGWIPDRVQVSCRDLDAEPVAVVCNGEVLQGVDEGVRKGSRIWTFDLREGMEWTNLAFRLPPSKDAGCVRRIELLKWRLLRGSRKGVELSPAEGVKNGWKFADPEFGRVKLAKGNTALLLALLELLILALSLAAAVRHRAEAWKTLWPSVAGVTLALAAVMQLVLPLQSYLANRPACPVMPGELCAFLALRFALAWAAGAVAAGWLCRCFGRWVLAPVLAFAACAYLESGILSIGLPILNGKWSFFENVSRGLWDGAVWAGVFVLFALLHRILARRYGVAGLCLAVLAGISLFDVRSASRTDASKWLVKDFSSREIVANSVVYSAERNVLVFVLDSLECEQAHAAMEDPGAGERLRGQFRGFTEYTDNVGTGDYSAVAVAAMLTGKYPESVEGISDYYDSIFSVDSVLKDYLDAGCATFLMEHRNYSNRRDRVTETVKAEPIPARRLQDGLGWTLPKIVRFRWLPFAAKLDYLRLAGPGGGTSRGNFGREWILYPYLARGTVEPGETGTFLVAHTEAVHVPVKYNRNGEYMPVSNDSDAGCIEMGIYVLGLLGDLMDVFREKGIYDNSTILVLADHGHHENLGGFGDDERRNGAVLPGTARPCLWVKPPGSRHGFSSCPIPTSHAKVAALLREAALRDLTDEDVRSILKTEVRLFRKLFLLEKRKEDWIAGADGSLEVRSGPVDGTVAGGPAAPLSGGVAYKFDLEKHAENFDLVQFENCACHQNEPTFLPDHPSMSLTFKVGDPAKRYLAKMDVSLSRYLGPNAEGTKMSFFQSGHEGQATTVGNETGAQVIQLGGLVPDADGRIQIVVERDKGFRAIVRFDQLLVDAEP